MSKKITFKNLSLVNFCGIREAEYHFGEGITTIKGRNGIGKSTIANAIHYVLFGTDIKGNALDIKTFDEDHNIIPEIEHSAELTLTADDSEYTLKRSLTDKWKDKECKNTYKYYVNGEVTTAGDFRSVVDGICTEITLRLASSPSYFVSLPWDKQRKFLEQLVPEITTEAITQGDEKFDFVTDALQSESIDQLLHHLKYQRTEIQKELDNVPVRLRELNAAQVEPENWDGLSQELAKATAQKQSVEDKINAVKIGAADQVRNENLRKQIDFQRKRIAEMERSARNLSAEYETKHLSDVLNATKEKSQAASTVDELKSKNQGFTETEIQLNAQLEQHKSAMKEAGEKYQAISTETWTWDNSNGFCLHCGQPLPQGRVAQMKRESEERFFADKAERLKTLLAEADAIKKEHGECKTMLENIKEERGTTTNQLVKAHKILNEAESRLAEIEKETPQTYEQKLEANENYRHAVEEVEKLEAALNQPGQGDAEQQQMLDELQQEKAMAETNISRITESLAKKASFERINHLIEKAKADKTTYQEQLDEIDQKLDVAQEYYQLSCSILEERVNEHFRYVKWSLFKTNLDGEKKPFCECYHNGVPYSRLNSAAKVNAGIDIAYTISDFYAVSVPMILDECESNTAPIYRGGQQVRLYVSLDNTLQFEYADGDKD